MTKEEIELIVLRVRTDEQDAIHIKNEQLIKLDWNEEHSR